MLLGVLPDSNNSKSNRKPRRVSRELHLIGLIVLFQTEWKPRRASRELHLIGVFVLFQAECEIQRSLSKSPSEQYAERRSKRLKPAAEP